MGDLAVEMRSVVTPVIGYLASSISQEDEPMSADRHLRWIETIEKRLEAIQELNDQDRADLRDPQGVGQRERSSAATRS